MNNTVVGLLVLAVLLIVAGGVVAFSVVFMNNASRQTAELNQQRGNPISNGYASVALIALIAIFALTFVLGLLPPILRR